MADEIEYEGLPANAGLGVSASQKKFHCSFSVFCSCSILLQIGEHVGWRFGEN